MALRHWHARSWFALIAAALCVGIAAGPASAGAGVGLPSLREAIEDNQRDTSDAYAALSQAEDRAREAAAELAVVEEALATAEQRLAELDERQAAAQRVHDGAAQQLAMAEGDVQTALRRLQHGLDQLSADRRDLGHQLAAAYRNGSGMPVNGLAGLVSHATSVTDFVVATESLRYASHRQRELVDRVAATIEQIERDRVALDRRRAQRSQEEAAARGALEEIREIAAQQRAIVAETRRQREERAGLLATIDEERGRYAALIGDLELESATLAEELRRYRFVAGAPGDAGELVWPTDGRVTSGYGSRHHPVLDELRHHAGIDIPAPPGQPIVASGAGRVVHAGPRGGYGLAVVVSHGGGLATLYAHQAKVLVAPGQTVAQGERIGFVGSTGQSTGPHLHFEIRVDGVPRDPLDWFRNHTGR